MHSMSEVPPACEDDCHAVLIGGLNHVFVSHGTPRLDYRDYTSIAELIDTITEWKEAVRCNDSAIGPLPCLGECPPRRSDPGLIAGTDTNGGPIAHNDDCIRLGVGRNSPCKSELNQKVSTDRTVAN